MEILTSENLENLELSQFVSSDICINFFSRICGPSLFSQNIGRISHVIFPFCGNVAYFNKMISHTFTNRYTINQYSTRKFGSYIIYVLYSIICIRIYTICSRTGRYFNLYSCQFFLSYIFVSAYMTYVIDHFFDLRTLLMVVIQIKIL